jgi:hypothetical protein
LYQQADKLYRGSHGSKENGMHLEKELDMLMDAPVSCDTGVWNKKKAAVFRRN